MDGIGALMGAIKRLPGGEDAVQPIHLGTVVTTQPLSVRAGQILLTAASLKADPRCVYVPPKNEPANPHQIVPGDEVLLVTSDGQVFVIVCKVVNG